MKKIQEKDLNNSNKRALIFSANFLFLLFFLGFCLTTNADAQILAKYSHSYLIKLFVLFLLIIPYNLAILFLLNNSISLKFGGKNYRISLPLRILLVILGFVLFLMLSELFFRAKPKPFVENFHPFLQYIPTKKNDSNMHINSDSFRYDELTKDKPKGTYRIFILGGSTVFDKPRPYEKSITKTVENLLQKKYPDKKIQVINAGYERYTSEHSLIVYETKVADYHPDMIVIWQGFNDIIYSCTPDFSPIRTYKNDYSHMYQVISHPIDDYFNWRFNSIVLSRIQKALFENFYADIRFRIPKPNDQIKYTDDIDFKSIDAYKRNMEYIVKAAKADNVKILIGNQPVHYDGNPVHYGLVEYFCKKNPRLYISTKAIDKGMKMFNDSTFEIAKKYDIPFIDLVKAIPVSDEYLTDDVHYTDKGDEKVAQTVYEEIVKSGYLENLPSN
jgi:lysophospholipase L1-like esterase